VNPDPTDINVLAGLEKLNENNSDTIVAIGGGSPMDTAKAISILKTNSLPLNQYMGYNKIPNPGIPLITIPTTAGTGSEATKVTVITDTENDVKMMILDDNLMPRVSLVDYELTISMPQPLTAHVGVDTLTHAIEAYVSKKANSFSDPLALSCISLVANHLYDAWKDPENRISREAMSIAACQGGMAFTNSSVCLVHGMSRPLGVQFHIPHGLSNALLLPKITSFSIAGSKQRYADVSRKMSLAKTSDSDDYANTSLVEGLIDLNQKLKVPSLRECQGVSQDKFTDVVKKMASDALASGSPQNNPVVPSEQEIIDLYNKVW
jgi:alcohol dehydrogenase class IV